MKTFHLILLFSIIFTSCDCNQRVLGTVIDKKTRKPLEGISVYNKNKRWNVTNTDSTGKFILSNVSGGFRCPPMTVIIEDSSYNYFETKIPSGKGKIIELTKKDSLNQFVKQIMDSGKYGVYADWSNFIEIKFINNEQFELVNQQTIGSQGVFIMEGKWKVKEGDIVLYKIKIIEKSLKVDIPKQWRIINDELCPIDTTNSDLNYCLKPVRND
ncbi:hypothetical protein RCC89_02895 [Cytophagaceae bacterium ABcell3]|nr:hypothetical protein RCC89_02895 [Cytophagaceae bacterium ABcell3]